MNYAVITNISTPYINMFIVNVHDTSNFELKPPENKIIAITWHEQSKKGLKATLISDL